MKISTIALLLTGILLCSCKGKLYRMTSGSMENTIKQGNRFFVASSKEFKKGDIVAFNYYGNYDYTVTPVLRRWHARIYRLVAFSGDTVQVSEANLYVNNRFVAFPTLAKIQYEVISVGHPLNTASLDENDMAGMTKYSQNKDTSIYLVGLTEDQMKEFQHHNPSASITHALYNPTNDTSFAKPSADANWSQDYYGPLLIPSPGETIDVNPGNFKLYQNIPDIRLGKNLIKEKLYFVLGDNRHGAEDSRYIGLISQSRMIGVAKIK
jgi:signal peptidase I